MEEILNSEQYKAILPYAPYIAIAGLLRIIFIIYLCTITRSTLLMIKKENRCILPGQVWLLLIPFFNIYWNFIVARRMTDSLTNECYDRSLAVEEDPAQKMGYFFAGSFLVYNFPIPMFVGFVIWIISFIALVLYCVKINEYKKLFSHSFSASKTNEMHEETLNKDQ